MGEKTPTRVTASLIFNNLSSNGIDLVYAHSHEAVLVPNGAGPAFGMPATPVLMRCKSAVMQVRFLQPPLSPTPVLAVLTHQQGLLYSPDGKRILLSVALPTSLPPGSYLRGVAACTTGNASYIFIGTSGNGDLLRVNATLFGDATELSNLCSGAVSDLDSGEGGVLVAAAATNAVNGTSEVVLMSLGADGAPVVSARLPEAAPGLCTALRVLGGTVFCAYSTGHIRTIDLKTRFCTAVVTAHARWINALEVHPSSGMFACAAEDGYVSVWRVLRGGKLAHIKHLHAPDCHLTGVAFVGQGGTGVAATAYDCDAVMSWRIEGM